MKWKIWPNKNGKFDKLKKIAKELVKWKKLCKKLRKNENLTKYKQLENLTKE